MLYIQKNGFSNKALNIIKRLAAFRNPDFYKAQAMRLPTFDKPRIISLSDETPDYLCLLRGCELDLVNLFDTMKANIEWADETFSGKLIKVHFNGQLRDEQAEAVVQIMAHDNGVLSATTAFGKTVIGAKLISERKINTLVLVHTQQLLDQWKERLSQFLTIDEELPADPVKRRGRKKVRSIIGQLGGGKKNLSGIIDIAVMQSLVKGDEVKDVVRDYGMVIVDECHHVPAFSFEQILKNISAKYVYGLTATPVRQDGHHPIIFMHCGPIRYKVDAKEQAEKRPFEHYIIPRFTPFRKPVSQDEKDWSIGEIYSQISTSQMRNQLIIEDVIKCVHEGRNPIILTERTAHVELIVRELSKTISNVIELTGGMSAKERKTKLTRISSIPPDENIVIVATGRFVGEGFDEPRLDTLFLAMPVAWKGTVQQYAERLHRLYQNKSEVQIYDYVDVHVGVLERMYHKRIKGYASIGYSAKSDSRPFEATNANFDNNNFMTVFRNDISSAKSEMIVVSPYMTKKRLYQMINILSTGTNNGAKLTIITRPEEDYKEKDRPAVSDMVSSIRLTGANLIFKSNIHQKFAVIDQRIVWYGSINFLSFGSAEESIMRLESINIANELIGTVEEMYFIMKENRKFNEEEYEEKLNKLGRELLPDHDAAASKVSEGTIEEFLDQIAYNTGIFPKEIIENVIYRMEEAIPFLLDFLRKVRDNPIKYRDEEGYFAHIYAAYLLAQFRVKEVYPILIDILSLPDDLPYDLFGDSILEAGSRMLASVCGYDIELIKELIESEIADDYMRSQAIEALAILVIQGVLERDELITYYKKLFEKASVRDNPLVLAFLVCSCNDIYPQELYEEIKKCYDEDLVDDSVINLKDVDAVMAHGKDYVLEESRNDKHLQYIEDTITELEWWACFDESYKERMETRRNFNSPLTVIKSLKIGRNDPCPCGSGKKYKKCCGK